MGQQHYREQGGTGDSLCPWPSLPESSPRTIVISATTRPPLKGMLESAIKRRNLGIISWISGLAKLLFLFGSVESGFFTQSHAFTTHTMATKPLVREK